jgi:hypothetical protein
MQKILLESTGKKKNLGIIVDKCHVTIKESRSSSVEGTKSPRATQVVSCTRVMTRQRWSLSLARTEWRQLKETRLHLS